MRTLTLILLFLTSIYACSRQSTVPTQPSYTFTPLCGMSDSLLTQTCIDFSFCKIHPVHFHKPEINVRDSFTPLEKCIVGATDETFFKHCEELIIDLENSPREAFVFPLPGARLLSSFGMRNGRPHTGMDLKINCRDTVVSAFDGIVRMAGWSRGYGNVIVVRHYNGLETVYAHNSQHLVCSGDHVSAGTPISITGETGRATTDHLHFEIRVNGKPINPTFLIDFNTQSLQQKCFVFSPDEKGKIRIETV